MKDNKSVHRKFIILETLFFVHSGIIGATYMLYLLAQGLTIFQANLVSVVFNIAILIFEIPSGAISDILGERKATLGAGITLFISMLLFFMSSHVGFLILAQMFWGISYALESGSVESWAIKVAQLKKNELDILFAYNAKINNIAMILGSFIGSFFAKYSLNYIWILPMLTAVLFTILSYFFMSSDNEVSTVFSNNYIATVKAGYKEVKRYICFGVATIRTNKQIKAVFNLNIIVAFSFSPMIIFWSVYLNNLAKEESYWFLAWMWFFIRVSSALGNYILQIFAKRNSRIQILIITVAITAIAAFIVGITQYIIITIIMILFQEMAYGIITPIQRAIINDFIEDDYRATLISFGSLYTSISKLLSSVLFGLFAELISIQMTWVLSGFISIFLLLYVILYKKVLAVS